MVDILPSPYGARRAAPSVEWLQSPARPALQLASALDAVRRAPSILEAIRSSHAVSRVAEATARAGVAPPRLLDPVIEALEDETDTITGLTAVHALARVPGSAAEGWLARLVFEGGSGFEEHAAWAAVERDPSPWLAATLAGALSRGGVIGMHAQTALSGWASIDPALVLTELERRLTAEDAAAARRYLVETIGLVPGSTARLSLERIAGDSSEEIEVRRAAIDAFVERPGERLPVSIGLLARSSGPLSAAVRAVRAQRALARRGPRGRGQEDGLHVAQLHLGAVLDAGATRAGSGDSGGVATLLSRVGSALAARSRVSEVLTIGRAPDGHERTVTRARGGHRFDAVRLEPGEGGSFTSPWPSLVAARRGIRAALLSRRLPDVIHLRMADPGSLAGSMVARELGVPVIFTLAPDPHVHIQARELGGQLDRGSFAREDAAAAYWLRLDVVERLSAAAREIALFPRPQLRDDIQRLVGIDIMSGRPRYTVVPEGVDTVLADRARATVDAGTTIPPVLAELDAVIGRLPRDRRGLPLALSVGRLHPVKGMARLVAAFAADDSLSERANLVIVGGDLGSPTPTEAAELQRIHAVLDGDARLRDRVILLGHRPNDDIALVMAAARAGWGEHIGAHGAYVCASAKEEFGLAIVEALAAGLPAVAPMDGGPASYLTDGRTGVLLDTKNEAQLALGVHRALDLSADPATSAAAVDLVRERFTIERMARTLAALYRVTSGATTLSHPVARAAAA